MTLDPVLVPLPVLGSLALIQLAALAWALRVAPWRQLLQVPSRFHLVFGSVLFLLLLGLMQIRVLPQARVHLLGLTVVTLLLGAPLALLAGSAALLLQTLLQQMAPAAALFNGVLNVTAPVLTTAAVLHLAVRFGPRNLYVYLLGAGFLGGALSMLIAFAGAAALLWLAGADRALQQWSPALAPLLAFPEGFLNGALVTMLAVYVPSWLKTFDDSHFLPQ
jgi:uncharacterized membrane protein